MKPKIISFDAEGTLVTGGFSDAVWHRAIPELYGKKYGLDFENASKLVRQEYDRVGDHRLEWYQINYWLSLWDLGDYHNLMQDYRGHIAYYPETRDILRQLSSQYKLIVCSSSAREFLDMLTEEIGGHFAAVFSSISDYGQVKNPGFYQTVCRLMEVKPEEIIHVGDSWDFDFKAPGEIGMRSFYLDRHEKRQGPNIVKNLQEFADQILKVL